MYKNVCNGCVRQRVEITFNDSRATARLGDPGLRVPFILQILYRILFQHVA